MSRPYSNHNNPTSMMSDMLSRALLHFNFRMQPVRTLLSVAFVCCLFVTTTAHASRVGNGTAPFPIWSELSYFERSTISTFYQAERDDPDALLALYLLASGVRESADYETVRGRIDQFLGETQKSIIEKDNTYLVGQLLNAEMHAFFFAKTSRNGLPRGYAYEQSRLMGIFENGEFNCISSALLYAVLARHFNLDVKGVILPSHAFIELDNRDRRIDVETTSANGFDKEHNEAFYERGRATNDGFRETTYADYLRRERVSPARLGLRNMLNQHTSERNMSFEDGSRLAEISAYLDPNNELAQEKRLYFYNREIQTLFGGKEWDTLKRLIDTTYSTVLADSSRMTKSPNFQVSLQLYLTGAMLAYAHDGDIDKTLTVLGEVLSRKRNINAPDRKEAEERVTMAVQMLLERLVVDQRFEEGVLVLSVTEGHLSNPQAWPDMTNWFYLQWAEYFWNQSKWKDVVEVLSDYTTQPYYKPKTNNKPEDLIGSAYYNWVLMLSQNNELEAAQEVLNQCLTRPAHQGLCGKASEALKQAQENTKS